MEKFTRGWWGLPALLLLPAWTTVGATGLSADVLWNQATAELQTGRVGAAIRSLESLSQVSPEDSAVWTALGRAQLQMRNFTGAAAAFAEALIREPGSPKAIFGLAEAHAASGEVDLALKWLRSARETRRIDISEIDINPHFASVRAVAGWKELLPAAAEFEHPFVESVDIIREWRGEAPEDQFGWIARNIGDVDGDGIADVVVSAPTHGRGGDNAGRIYVYSTGRNKLLWTADGRPGDQLGSGVEGVGDTDGDGVPDVAASGPEGGVAYIYSGRDGKVLHSFRARRKDEVFGNHVSGAGDFDGDGSSDVIVGAPGKPGAKRNPGHAYVYSGKSGSLLLTLDGERPGDAFGSTVAGYARNGVRFLVVGAPSAGKTHHGRVYVYRDGAKKPSFTIEADERGNALGAMFVSVLGDIDGDGIADIYASDWSHDAKGPSTGRVYIYSGRTGQPLYTLTGEDRGDGFGTSPAVAGDIDGDGHSDLIVGAWQYGSVVVGGGRAYLYSGTDGQLLKTYTCRVPGDTFGFDAVGLGDVDRDGVDDLLITSGWSAVNGHHSGRVFVISSGVRHVSSGR